MPTLPTFLGSHPTHEEAKPSFRSPSPLKESMVQHAKSAIKFLAFNAETENAATRRRLQKSEPFHQSSFTHPGPLDPSYESFDPPDGGEGDRRSKPEPTMEQLPETSCDTTRNATRKDTQEMAIRRMTMQAKKKERRAPPRRTRRSSGTI
jgi:hypothetical protein